jgi:hypothetical protein
MVKNSFVAICLKFELESCDLLDYLLHNFDSFDSFSQTVPWLLK